LLLGQFQENRKETLGLCSKLVEQDEHQIIKGESLVSYLDEKDNINNVENINLKKNDNHLSVIFPIQKENIKNQNKE